MFFPILREKRILNRSILCFNHVQFSLISQYPPFGAPQRTRIPFSFNFFMLDSTFLLLIPISSAIFTAESCGSFDKSSKILCCVSFNSSPMLLRCFSDVSPMLLRCFSIILRIDYQRKIPEQIDAKHVIKSQKLWSRQA